MTQSAKIGRLTQPRTSTIPPSTWAAPATTHAPTAADIHVTVTKQCLSPDGQSSIYHRGRPIRPRPTRDEVGLAAEFVLRDSQLGHGPAPALAFRFKEGSDRGDANAALCADFAELE